VSTFKSDSVTSRAKLLSVEKRNNERKTKFLKRDICKCMNKIVCNIVSCNRRGEIHKIQTVPFSLEV